MLRRDAAKHYGGRRAHIGRLICQQIKYQGANDFDLEKVGELENTMQTPTPAPLVTVFERAEEIKHPKSVASKKRRGKPITKVGSASTGKADQDTRPITTEEQAVTFEATEIASSGL
jgi:hypothetical protein